MGEFDESKENMNLGENRVFIYESWVTRRWICIYRYVLNKHVSVERLMCPGVSG